MQYNSMRKTHMKAFCGIFALGTTNFIHIYNKLALIKLENNILFILFISKKIVFVKYVSGNHV